MTGTCGGIFFCAKPTLIMGDVWIMGVYQPKIGAPVGPRVSTSYQKCPTDVFGWQPWSNNEKPKRRKRWPFHSTNDIYPQFVVFVSHHGWWSLQNQPVFPWFCHGFPKDCWWTHHLSAWNFPGGRWFGFQTSPSMHQLTIDWLYVMS